MIALLMRHRRVISTYVAASRTPSELIRLLLVRYKLARRPLVKIGSRTFGTVVIRPAHTDMSVAGEMLAGSYDAALSAAASSPKLILDLGAHIGLAARTFLTAYPSAELIAVEPHPDNARLLERNLSGYNTTIFRTGVASSNRRVSLTRDRLDGCKITPGEDMVTMTVPDLIGDRDVDLMKVDIEGTEEELFDACSDWIEQVAVIVCECHYPYTGERMVDALRRNGASPEIVELRELPMFGYDLLTVTRASADQRRRRS